MVFAAKLINSKFRMYLNLVKILLFFMFFGAELISKGKQSIELRIL